MTYNSLQGTFTTMIGFVTWPPYKSQVTKPIIVVKVPCKLLYVIQVKEFLIKCSTSWPYLISEFLVAYITIVASDWPRTFFTPKVFLFSISLLFVREENIMKKLLEKLLSILTTT